MALDQELISHIEDSMKAVGKIAENESALIVSMKKQRRLLKNSHLNLFVLTHKNFRELSSLIKKLIKLPINYKFQFVVKLYGDDNELGHWASGEFTWAYDKNDLKLFLYDSVGLEHSKNILLKMLSGGFDFVNISNCVNFQVFLGADKVQYAEFGCSYLALDTAFMISNQDNYDNYDNLYESIIDNENMDPVINRLISNFIIMSDAKNLNIYSVNLPLRLLRMKQSYSNLEPILNNDSLANKVVTRRGKTFKESVSDKITEVNGKKINSRNEFLREKSLKYFKIFKQNIKNPELLSKEIEDNKIDGLRADISKLTIDIVNKI